MYDEKFKKIWLKMYDIGWRKLCIYYGKTASYQGYRRRGMRLGDLKDVVTADFEVGGVPGRGIPGKGKHSRQIEGEFHLSTLEVQGGYHAGGTVTATEV